MRPALDLARFVIACLCLVLAVAPLAFANLPAELTPLGAERKANAAGTIPEWTGGLSAPPANFAGPGARYVDPFPEDKPLYTITAATLDQHRERLSAGQLALLERYPQSYSMPVYPSRRSAAAPAFVYEQTARNAAGARLTEDGEGVLGAVGGIPFPTPRSGKEAIWNHKLRYQGGELSRWNAQAVVAANGEFELVKLREQVRFLYHSPAFTPDSKIFAYLLAAVTYPARLASGLVLVHETVDQTSASRKVWTYSPRQDRVLAAPEIAYDHAGAGADGLRTVDQLDSFNGALDRYDWSLQGKRELLIPYNAYRLHSDRVRYADLLQRGHLNPALTRYEPHRVWVVEARLKPGVRHLYALRRLYLDEDSWQIHQVEVYDARGQLWRVQDAHSLVAYDQPYLFPALEAIYDLPSGRYLVQGMSNEEPERTAARFAANHFTPLNLRKNAQAKNEPAFSLAALAGRE